MFTCYIEKVKAKVAQSCPTLRPHGLYSLWNSPGQNTGVGSLSLLQGSLPNPGIEPSPPTLQVNSLPAESILVIIWQKKKKKQKKPHLENVNKFVLFGLKRPSVVILFIFEIFSWLNILWSLNSPTKE